MSIELIVGGAIIIIGVTLIVLYGKAKEKGGSLKADNKAKQGSLDIRKDADEHKKKTANSSRRDFLDMGK